MGLEASDHVVAIVGGVLGIVAIVGGCWLRWGRPRQQMGVAVNTAILGRPEVTDRSGSVIQKAQPGMVAQVALLAEKWELFENTERRVGRLEQRVGDHDIILADLHASHRERIANKVEQTAAWSAIEAVAKTSPPADD